MFVPRLLAFLWLLCFASGAAVLSDDELEALKTVASALGKMDWDFSVDPCSGSPEWVVTVNETEVRCDPLSYEFNGSLAHVTHIYLKRENLNGTLPGELVRLPYLQEIDLTRNYLNGTIPLQWASMQSLRKIAIQGNRITGSIPKELANITTLEELVLDSNQLSGTIPSELGNLPRLKRLMLASNNLIGDLPTSLANLTTLTEFRINNNNFTGNIPNFIQAWTNLKRLMIQGSGLTGPIPAGIASLTKLTDLRISDLNGDIKSSFPPLSNILNFRYLILRNCYIVDQLPTYIGNMNTLINTLDLSFNKLTGEIPESFSNLNTDFIYLTGNMLSGPIPPWMSTKDNYIDLSYNNFSSQSSEANCGARSELNLFASSTGTTSNVFSCTKTACKPKYHSLRINCGGRRVSVDEREAYEEDMSSAGASNLVKSGSNTWGLSSTGHFLDDDQPNELHTLTNKSNISGPNAELYMNARLSPLSLTYYGVCLINGNYTVHLHFAEIQFSDSRTYSSLGIRIFDVYIQGRRVLKDFNIEEKAGGVNKAIVENFTAIVTNHTLEIRLFWAGKGTTDMPERGMYGPLISAISYLSGGGIVGVVIAVVAAAALLSWFIWWKCSLRWKYALAHHVLKGVDVHTGSFTLRQLKAATNNFDPANKIGEGGFGPVYKGVILDGTIIAVKQLSSKSSQGNREFINEIGMISALQHPNLVKLYGCCIEGDQLLIVYEYLENNSLGRALFGPKEKQLNLDWATRYKICIGIAKGLAHLHEESRLKIVHRDIKATNVLLDRDLVPKISDFGLAKLDEQEDSHISTRIAGTYGYMAPEYALRGYLTDKADVYSYGVVVLEVISGRVNTISRSNGERYYLLELANTLREKGDLTELIDERLVLNYNKEEANAAMNVVFLCTNGVASERPSMSSVVSMLEGRVAAENFIFDSGYIYRDRENPTSDQWVDCSTDTVDLYPILLETECMGERESSEEAFT